MHLGQPRLHSFGHRIAIIGNGGGGKSTLARKLGHILQLPVIHVDTIQFQSGWRRTPKEECDRKLIAAASDNHWIIDGFGSDQVIVDRINIADTLLFVDFPIWKHYWWALKRQLASRKGQRQELPENCPEFTISYTLKLIEVMWLVHRQYTPWFRELAAEKSKHGKVVVIRHPREIASLISDAERAVATR